MSDLTLLDILFRALCLGQLLFFVIFLAMQALRHNLFTIEHCALGALLICCMGAVVLTMYHRPPLIYSIRPVLLALTDGLPFIFWLYVMSSLSDAQRAPQNLLWLRLGGALYLVWHLYYFIIEEGRGWPHDVVHTVAGLAVLHIIIQSVVTWRDDLVDSRRRRRAIFLVAASTVLIIYVVSEVSDLRFMRSELGSLIGASVMLALTLSLGVFCFLDMVPKPPEVEQVNPSNKPDLSLEEIPAQHQELYQRLSEFIENQGFTEPRITLNRLAERLGSKEHRLRALINQSLGYRNFSSYLNDYRLPLACDWLENKPEQAITDIALSLGYGSITSFNRAFKSRYGVAPTDYRASTLENG